MKQKSTITSAAVKKYLVLILTVLSFSFSQFVYAQTCNSCVLGYPDNSNLPKSAVVFNENEVLRAMDPSPSSCTVSPTVIKLWYNDEHAMTLGVRQVNVKTAAGITTTNYTVSPYGGTPACLNNPAYGATANSGDQSGNDVADGGGRPLRPVLYLTDLTVNGSTSRIGDWQQGGVPYNPTSICGSWKSAVRTVDYTKNPVQITVTPDADPTKNNWDLAGGEAPPAGTTNEGYGTVVRWDVASLGLIPGHIYRIQVIVHDGDQNKTGGDCGTMCTTTLIATPPDCSCVTAANNLLVNPSFENGTTGWSWSGGTLTTGTGYVTCGAANGFNNWSAGTSNVWQDVAVAPGAFVTFKGYAGTHTPGLSCSPKLSLIFLNAANTVLGQSDVAVTRDVDVNFAQLEQYTINATAPTGTTKVRVQSSITCNTMKIDAFCLTSNITLGSIGDRVWLDANGNGLQDATETGGLTGVTVQLRNSVGTVIATTTTNASGNYIFGGLVAGTYTVGFPVSISGAVVTTQNVGTNDNIDSDPSQTTGITANIVLGTGQHIDNVDAGYCPTILTLGNRVWYDANNNGINDTENGIAGVTVKLYKDDNNDNVADGASIATLVTDVDGYYLFTNLSPGNYIIGAVMPAGYVSSSINGGDPDNDINLDDNGQVLVGNEIRGLAITLIAGTEPTGGGNENITYDFGLLPDCNCTTNASNLLVNGNFENGTTGWSWSGGTLTTGTGYIACGAANGFNNWSAGTSKVWQDVAVTAGSTVTFKGFAGTHTPGITCSPTLSLIFLNAANTVLGQSNATVTRDVDINHSQLEQYTITAIAPLGTTKVRVQSAINCNTMKMDAFCLTSVAPPVGSIGDRVFNDLDGDGIQDANEVGVAGVTVTLLNAAGQPIATTTTDAFGNYKFSGLPAGDYSIRVTPPANYSLSPKGQGGDPNLDSDFDPITYTTSPISLLGGQNRTDVDAGLKFTQPQPASIGDRVWLDTNGDGIQDAGEPGVSNVLVTLYNSVGAPVRSTYTDVNGNYLFTDVTPGTYSVGVSLPPAFVFSPNNGAITGATNSDIVPATGRTTTFTVSAGEQITYVDAGLKQQQSANGSVGDFVWNDINKNGIQEAGEPGIAGVTVRLVNATTNAIVATATTDATGKYIFNDVPVGDYQVDFVTPGGYTTTTKLNSNVATSATDSDVDPATSKTAIFTVVAGQRITTVDAGYWLTTPPGTGKIGDRVWLDANQNGVQDAGEANVQGVTVTLYDGANTAIKQAVTDANGNYLFTDLAAGNYTVGFSNIPQGFTFTTQGAGTAATGSDANVVTGKTATIVLAAGQTNLDVDAGIRAMMAGTASIGNRVWNDLNNNGIQEAGEPGIQGVIVELLDGNGNPIDSDPATPGIQPTTRVTNALGEYLFTGLPAGDYKVRFSNLPAGFNAAPKGAGTDRNLDSDGNPIVGGTSTTDVISVASGEEKLDIDFGLNNPTAPTGQIGDYVWFDSNNNGVQDAGEQGVPGVTVSLLNASNTVIATTVTDANGNYRFVNLADATYSVQFSNLPAGFVFSPANQGANDAVDSDADPVTGITGTYTITAGNTNVTVDAGIYSTRAALGDYVWFDANSNGIQDATEKGIAGITVTIYDAANVAVTSAITDQNGRYFFSNLNPGTYTVGFGTIPSKLIFTLKDVVAAGDAADSDVDPATGKTGAYTLAAGQVNLTVDAGLKPFVPATIGDFVWFDYDRDGIQDVGEPGVAGIIVTLYNAANQPIGSAVTDGNGFYQISNVPPGTGYYTVFTNKPIASAPWTLQNVGGAGANDNSKVDATGKSAPFNVAEGQNISNMDAGLYNQINLSGNVWHDVNAMTDNLVNNTRGPNDALIPTGLKMILVDAITGVVVRTALIQGNGAYNFPNITPGSYILVLKTENSNINDPSPFASLPDNWENTGEHLGLTPGRDAVINGKLSVTVTTFSVTNANFGIRLKPLQDDDPIN